MSDRTRRVPEVATDAGHDHPAPVASPDHLAPGGGNAMMLGNIGNAEFDNGTRTNADGTTEYGHDRSNEGWLTGMVREMDRNIARAELSSRFQVVDENFVGPRLPNQVTAEEFDNIATMYSDIRTGATNIEFGTGGMTDDDATAFRTGAMGDIATMLTTNQGRELLDQLAYQQVDGRDLTTTIGRAANPGAAGADVGPGGSYADAVNGTGTNTAVNYVPGHTVDMATDLGNPNYESSEWRNIPSDVVLFHELIHANHGRMGILDGEIRPDGSFHREAIDPAEAAGPHDVGTAREEYETVGLSGYGGDLTENNYRQERGLVNGTPMPVRDNYNGSGPKPTP